jgi:hypothetical protein
MDMEGQSNRIRVSRLFVRGGLFHAVVDLPLAGDTIEVVLHGISTIEDALRAVKTFCGTVAVPFLGDEAFSSLIAVPA